MNDSNQLRFTSYLFKATMVGLISIFLAFSMYTVWGWITVTDIKRYCIEKGLDADEVLNKLGVVPEYNVRMENKNSKPRSKIPDDSELSISTEMATPPYEGPLARLRLLYQTMSYDEADDKFSLTTVNLLTLFVRLSDNVLNTLFTFSVAYLISFVILVVRTTFGRTPSLRYWLLRPLAGGLVGAVSWVLLLSGVSLVWNDVSNARGLSVGVIAAFAAFYCEKFEQVLVKVTTSKEQQSEPTG
ncbi:MAG: hypothetical protein MN733_00140 [Nitrososphaera sp.]|nr:hypothetical protein [Nitrososphaera sp.]